MGRGVFLLLLKFYCSFCDVKVFWNIIIIIIFIITIITDSVNMQQVNLA